MGGVGPRGSRAVRIIWHHVRDTETFDSVALAVSLSVVRDGPGAAGRGRDDGLTGAFGKQLAQGIGVAAPWARMRF